MRWQTESGGERRKDHKQTPTIASYLEFAPGSAEKKPLVFAKNPSKKNYVWQKSVVTLGTSEQGGRDRKKKGRTFAERFRRGLPLESVVLRGSENKKVRTARANTGRFVCRLCSAWTRWRPEFNDLKPLRTKGGEDLREKRKT